MLIINYFFIIFCVGGISAASIEINKIQNVEGIVKIIEFDSESNAYVAGNSGQTFYKLISSRGINKEVVVKENFQNIEKIIVNPLNNVYIFNYESNLRRRSSIYLLKYNSTVVDKLYEYLLDEAPHVSFADRKGNLFFNTAFGVAFLNRDQRIPTAVIGLENFYIPNDSAYVIDQADNVYIGGADNRLAVVRNDQVELFAPTAKFYDSPVKSEMTGVGLDNDGRIIVGYSGQQARMYVIENEWSPNLTAVFSQHQHRYTNFHLVNSKMYFFSQNLFNGECNLNLIYSIYDSIISYIYQYRVEQLGRIFESDICARGRTVADTEGNVFLSGGDRIYLLRNDEAEVRDVNYFDRIFSLDVDDNGDLWVLGRDYLNVVRRNSTEVNQITRFSAEGGLIRINRISREMFLGTESGLFVVV